MKTHLTDLIKLIKGQWRTIKQNMHLYCNVHAIKMKCATFYSNLYLHDIYLCASININKQRKNQYIHYFYVRVSAQHCTHMSFQLWVLCKHMLECIHGDQSQNALTEHHVGTRRVVGCKQGLHSQPYPCGPGYVYIKRNSLSEMFGLSHNVYETKNPKHGIKVFHMNSLLGMKL